MQVINSFEGRRNKEDNGYLQEIAEMVTEFIANNSEDIVQAIQNNDSDVIYEKAQQWLQEDCHSAED